MPKDQNKKDAAQTEQEAQDKEKIVTKYDRKVQRRLEEKAKEEREKKFFSTLSTLVLLALVCLVLSFPIRTWISLNSSFINVGGEDVTRVEFDYSYNTVLNNYVNNYSSYLSLFGLDPTQDLSKQSYDGSRSWEDYFQEMAVDAMKRSKSLKADGQNTGFTCDTSADYQSFVDQTQDSAKAMGVSVRKYVKQAYGKYATLDRIKPFVEEALYVDAYTKKLREDMTPSAEEVEAKYQEAKDDYDSVDYRILQFDAELPTEPTDLADPVDDTEENADEDAAYQPSQAEIDKAMKDAKVLADEALTKVKTDGELVENNQKSTTNTVIADWLFDKARKNGDTTVLEDTGSNRYYTVEFVKRYRDDTATANIRALIASDEEQANQMYEDWKAAGATEEAFIKLCTGIYKTSAAGDEGLVKGMSKTEDMYPELIEWMFEDGRKVGDCQVITIEDTSFFVVMYAGEGHPVWYNTIESTTADTALNDYVNALKDACELKDPSKHLKYLEILASEEAASAAMQEASDETTDTDDTASEEGNSAESENN